MAKKKLPDVDLSTALSLPHRIAVRAVTGMWPQELYDAVAMGRGPLTMDEVPLDKALHAYASKLATKRLGPGVASAIGGAKEFAQGLGSLAMGGPFVGPGALDIADIQANEAGIMEAFREQLTRKQQGGKVPNLNTTFRMPTKEVMEMQQGGLIPGVTEQAMRLRAPATGTTAAAGRAEQAAQQLGGFSPFAGPVGGTAQQTLQQMFRTGMPVETGAITEAARGEAERFFQQQQQQINEQMGALGLGSSTARTGALGRALGEAGAYIGEQGLRAGVAAQEAARQRQLGAFQPFMAGTGQQLAGQQAGLQGLLGAGQLRLGGEQLAAQTRLGGLGLAGNIGLGLAPIQAQQMAAPPARAVQAAAPRAPAPRITRPRVTGPRSVGPRPAAPRIPGPTPTRPRTSGRSLRPSRWQKGGKVEREDFGDYLSKFLFGREFERMPYIPPQTFVPPATPKVTQAEGKAQRAIQRLQEAALRRSIYGTPDVGLHKGVRADTSAMSAALARQLAGPLAQAWAPGGLGGLTRLVEAIGGPQAAAQGLRQTGQIMGQLGTAVARQQAPRYYVQGAQGQQQGGKIDGPAVPPDQIPILAQGGEGIIPVKMMDELEKSKSSDPLIKKLQDLMGYQKGGKVAQVMGEFKRGKLRSGPGKGPKVTDKKQAIAIALSEARKAGEKVAPKKKVCGGKVKYQAGGQIPTEAGNEFIKQLTEATGGVPTFTQANVLPTAALSVMGTERDPRREAMENALRRLSLIQSAMVTDPQGGGIQTAGPPMMQQQLGILQELGQQEAVEKEAELRKEQIEANKELAMATREMGRRGQIAVDPLDEAMEQATDIIGKPKTPGAPGPSYTPEDAIKYIYNIMAARGQLEQYPQLVELYNQIIQREQAEGNVTEQIGEGMLDQEVGQIPQSVMDYILERVRAERQGQ